ncbi:hypothetical protein HID58_060338, partial [Brassica napus]
FCHITGNFTIITLDLLPKVLTLLPSSATYLGCSAAIMADFLHKAIGAMSFEDEEPLALAAPPGFPPLFPKLSPADQKMAMLYISHSDETERNARILRVRQGIEDNRESSLRLIRITNEIDKGKGHVFHYTEKSIYQEDSSKRFRVGPQLLLGNTEDEAESSANAPDTLSAPAFVSSGFQLRPTLEGRASGNLSLGKAARNRPPSWKRKANPKKGNSAFGPALKGQEQSAANEGIEELIKDSWGPEGFDQSNTMERIGRCRKRSWNEPRIRELIAEEDVEHILQTPFDLSHHQDQKMWGFSRNGSYNSKNGPSYQYENLVARNKWQKPPPGITKCNVASSWVDPLQKSGAAWITRSHIGIPLVHSRSAILPPRPLKQDCALCYVHVIFKISSPLVLEAINAPMLFPNVPLLLSKTLRSLHQFDHCQVMLVSEGVNSIALEIAA